MWAGIRPPNSGRNPAAKMGPESGPKRDRTPAPNWDRYGLEGGSQFVVFLAVLWLCGAQKSTLVNALAGAYHIVSFPYIFWGPQGPGLGSLVEQRDFGQAFAGLGRFFPILG